MHQRTKHGVIFELSGGDLSLDFANTFSHRRTNHPVEWLNDLHDILAWAHQAKILSDLEVRRLQRQTETNPGRAVILRRRALALREGIFRVMSAIASRRRPQAGDLGSINREVAATFDKAVIAPAAAGFSWAWAAPADAPERILWAIARAAADLLLSPKRIRVRECAGAECAWLFIDTSRNRSRRWCDMSVCGNRAKIRRFRAHARAAVRSTTDRARRHHKVVRRAAVPV